MQTRKERTRGCSWSRWLCRRLCGIVQARSRHGKATTVAPELWRGLGCSERTLWRLLQVLPAWIQRQRIYDHDAARWRTMLLYVPGVQQCGKPRPQEGAKHNAHLPRPKLQLKPWTPAAAAVLGAYGTAPAAAAVTWAAASLERLAARSAPAAAATVRIWAETRDGKRRMPGSQAWRLGCMALALDAPCPGLLIPVETAENTGEGTNNPECQHHITGGLVLTDQTEMETPGGGARSSAGDASGGPAGQKVPAECRSTNIKRCKAWESRRNYAVAGREIQGSSGRKWWKRPLVAAWLARIWDLRPEGRIKAALGRGLTWAWGGYMLAKETKCRPDPPCTLAALAQAERLLGLRD